MTLREALTDWTDWDAAAHALATSIGLMDESDSFSTDAKHVYWTNTAVGHGLQAALEAFVMAGFLERRDAPDIQFRWVPGYSGSWRQ